MKHIKLFENFNEELYVSSVSDKHLDLKYLKDELIDLEKDLKQLFRDQEQEIGQIISKTGDSESEDGVKVRDEYGARLEKLEKDIEKKKGEIKILDDKLNTPRKPRAIDPVVTVTKILNKHKEDIAQSKRSWPNRTPQEEAEIYKKRFEIAEPIETIISALNNL